MTLDERATARARRRYDRTAMFYDRMESLMERARFAAWRRLLWGKVEGRRILEVGVGTGKNFPYYPVGAEVTAIDFSGKMLRRAADRAGRLGVKVDLRSMDVQALGFLDDTFDTVVATFVFCSVPDPLLGLFEVRRVLKPGGKLVLLEHVLSGGWLARRVMLLLSPLVVRLVGANIDRRTVENVARSGLVIEAVTNLAGDIVKLIEARKR